MIIKIKEIYLSTHYGEFLKILWKNVEDRKDEPCSGLFLTYI